MAELTYPGGQVVNVEFDEAAHSYQVRHKLADGQFSDYRPTHGITAPLVTVPKPYLKPWAAKMATNATLEYFLDHPETVELLPQFFQDLKDYEEVTLDENGKKVMTYYRFAKNYPWYSKVKKAADTKSGDSMEIGTWLHAAVEDFYNSGRKKLPVLTPLVEAMWESFKQFDNFFKPTPDKDGLEFIVYSLLFGYSGQGDFRGKMGGRQCIGDWKTSNRSAQNQDGISVEYFFQLGGLAQAEFERTGVWVDDLFVANFSKDGGEPRVIFASEFGMSPQDCARAYVGCFNTYHTIQEWDYKYKQR
jgi:TusA-related sulfurtransferase